MHATNSELCNLLLGVRSCIPLQLSSNTPRTTSVTSESPSVTIPLSNRQRQHVSPPQSLRKLDTPRIMALGSVGIGRCNSHRTLLSSPTIPVRLSASVRIHSHAFSHNERVFASTMVGAKVLYEVMTRREMPFTLAYHGLLCICMLSSPVICHQRL